ncbi:MAG: hypothetical protein FRX49_11308 [Trebouxia sp. A1-2]|nr:MAG: hypothetical protein FRX49_11308 [Trebouxia sp. A1-2]
MAESSSQKFELMGPVIHMLKVIPRAIANGPNWPQPLQAQVERCIGSQDTSHTLGNDVLDTCLHFLHAAKTNHSALHAFQGGPETKFSYTAIQDLHMPGLCTPKFPTAKEVEESQIQVVERMNEFCKHLQRLAERLNMQR